MLLLAFAFVPAFALGVLQAAATFWSTRDLLENNYIQGALIAMFEESREIRAARILTGTLAAIPDLLAMSRIECRATLSRFVAGQAKYGAAAVVRPDGTVDCTTAETDAPVSLLDQSWYAKFAANPRVLATGPHVGVLSGEPVLIILAPIPRRDDRYGGAVGISIRIPYLQTLLDDKVVGDGARTALLNRNGDVIVAQNFRDEDRSWVPSPDVIRRQIAQGRTVFRGAFGESGDGLFAIAPQYGGDIYFLAGNSTHAIFPGIDWRLVSAVSLPIIIWALAVSVVWIALNDMVIRWIVRLRRLAVIYSAGRFDARAGNVASAPEEIRQLSTAMDLMAETVSRREDSLREALREQKALLREVYHRVRNNLQLISSLLNLQLRNAASEEEASAVLNTQARVNALALAQRTVYEADSIRGVALNSLLPQLVHNALAEQPVGGRSVPIDSDIDALTFDPDAIVPLALLVTEAVANFASFIDTEQGPAVRISLKRKGNEGVLEIAHQVKEAREHWIIGMGDTMVDRLARQIGGRAARDERAGWHTLTVVLPLSEATETRKPPDDPHGERPSN